MTTINGIITKVAPKTVVSVNGAAFISHNGIRQLDYDKWKMVWNGNHFAPPSLGSILYLPGVPGAGSTTFDFSHNMLDSAINTNEELDDSETGVNVTPSGATALPVGSVIRVDDELMFVSATGNTLTVIRGFETSAAVGHDTNKDIYVRTKNDGTVNGATWKQLPTGVGYLDFDGTNDDIDLGTSIDLGTADFVIKFWCKLAGDSYVITQYEGANDRWLIKRGALTANKMGMYGRTAGQDNILRLIGNTDVTFNVWHHIVMVGDRGTRGYIYLDGADDTSATQTCLATDLNNTSTIYLARYNSTYEDIDIALVEICQGILWSASQVGQSYQQERHLFGV